MQCDSSIDTEIQEQKKAPQNTRTVKKHTKKHMYSVNKHLNFSRPSVVGVSLESRWETLRLYSV